MLHIEPVRASTHSWFCPYLFWRSTISLVESYSTQSARKVLQAIRRFY